MALSIEEIEERIRDIKRHVNRDSEFYGKLLNWHDFVWHYGIGLSDDLIFDTGQGMQTFESRTVNANFVLGIDQIAFNPGETIERLTHALRCFGSWDYGLLGWNCEHFARLIATDVAISYEVQKTLFAWLNHGGYHPTAQQDFRAYLSKESPSLNR
ncbi:hypothetical protein [Leptolyngbya sp. FACHB-261]|uniref:hypothetical protein n=1 Tax=Leptolyngbya sp. FACHB-261 TaxID=2692806 RepID=UPI001689C00E|nr:hypothetical protein [Leptolyngbya sp. FACHB-261]MBD2104941.1 hypothetical protein [Leptolyngbya sp. FACHB-261]